MIFGRRARAAAEAKDRKVSAAIAEVLELTAALNDDVNRLRAALRKVDRRDR